MTPNSKQLGYDAAQIQRSNDDLDRWRFASDIVEVVLATPSEWSARIGIFGKWGEGKTTVLHFAESMLREKGSASFLHSSPWAVQNWGDLWEEFGNRLAEALEDAGIPFDNSWKKPLKAASKWLEDSAATELAESAATLMGKDKVYKATVGAAFGAVSRWLRYDGEQVRRIREKLRDQRLVVMIDDLDRCAPDLLPQLFLSLRELFDLPGFTFLPAAFDDEIVGGALAQQEHPRGGKALSFWKKILDFRFYLPPITESQKERFVRNAMNKYCPFVQKGILRRRSKDLLPNNP